MCRTLAFAFPRLAAIVSCAADTVVCRVRFNPFPIQGFEEVARSPFAGQVKLDAARRNWNHAMFPVELRHALTKNAPVEL